MSHKIPNKVQGPGLSVKFYVVYSGKTKVEDCGATALLEGFQPSSSSVVVTPK